MQPNDVIIAGRYKLGKEIGEGAFGEIYMGVDMVTQEDIALKIEFPDGKRSQLLVEAKVYEIMKNGTGIPKVYWWGTEGEYNIMAMELLGPSLEDLLSICDGHFSLATVVNLADQLISRVEHFHSNNFLHRDIKPDNFVIGRGSNSTTAYIIDYGMAKRFRDSATKSHIPYRDKKKLTGTVRYASLNTHMGIEQSRRDDLECLLNTLIYLLKGELPWQGLQAREKLHKYDKIFEMKKAISADHLCKELPIEFSYFLKYCRQLKFEDRPNYTELKRKFKELFVKKQLYRNFQFDWKKLKVDLEVVFDRTTCADDSNIAVCESDRIEKKPEVNKEYKKSNFANESPEKKICLRRPSFLDFLIQKRREQLTPQPQKKRTLVTMDNFALYHKKEEKTIIPPIANFYKLKIFNTAKESGNLDPAEINESVDESIPDEIPGRGSRLMPESLAPKNISHYLAYRKVRVQAQPSPTQTKNIHDFVLIHNKFPLQTLEILKPFQKHSTLPVFKKRPLH